MDYPTFFPQRHKVTAALRLRSGQALAAGAMAFASVSTLAIAQSPMTHYLDVETGAWYEDAAAALLESGALDDSEPRLRPGALATRAEVAKLLVNVSGRSTITPSVPSFNDVPKSAWYYSYVETAADAGWVKGDANCYETSRPCTARPADGVNRAEMAALMERAFNLTYDRTAPVFPDNRAGTWYFIPVQTAADHCILQGDGAGGTVRPEAKMNRAEMVVMFHRAQENWHYGEDCGTVPPNSDVELNSVNPLSLRRVRLVFSEDLQASVVDDASRYTVARASGGGDIDVTEAIVIDDRTVELRLENDVIEGVTYRVNASALRTSDGVTFSDSGTFNFEEDTTLSPRINTVTVRTNNSIRVVFNTDVDAGRADDDIRYTLERTGSSGGSIGITDAQIIDDRTVDLTLSAMLASNASYELSVTDMRTDGGENFSDDATFVMTGGVPDLVSINALSATRLELNFNVDLDEATAEDRFSYRVRGPDGDVAIGRADLVDDRKVELTLDSSLQSQQEYDITVTDLMTGDDVEFSDTRTFVYGASDKNFMTTLLGIREVPPVVTSASGTGSFVLTSTGLRYDITLRSISGSLITGAHFHPGATGLEGSAIETITFSGLRATGTWEGLTASERDMILDGNIYVNVHTVAYPDGEIRGQVVAQ